MQDKYVIANPENFEKMLKKLEPGHIITFAEHWEITDGVINNPEAWHRIKKIIFWEADTTLYLAAYCAGGNVFAFEDEDEYLQEDIKHYFADYLKTKEVCVDMDESFIEGRNI